MLIESRREDEYWDFKEKHHENTADLLHDIICMVNNRADRDAYIIFGIEDKTFKLKGVISDCNRRNQQNIIDQLKSKKFSGGVRPRIELRTLNINGIEVDVLVIKNSTDTPYYLTEEYRDKGRIVRPYHIYTRICDTNTDIDKSADTNHVEYLWKKRFLLNRPPLEQIIKRLKNKDEWKSEEEGLHNIYNPEFTISIEYEDERTKPEYYSYAMTNESTSYQLLRIKYFGTQLYSHQIVILDSGRYLTSTPKWEFLYFGQYKIHADYAFKFYIKDEMAFRLHEFLFDEESEDAVIAKQRFCEVVLIFESQLEKDLFVRYIYNKKERFKKELYILGDKYSWVESRNKEIHDTIVSRLNTGIVLNKMLEEFRNI